jgi:hypothetical protein
MTQPGTVTVPPSPLRLLGTLLVGNLLMAAGILGVSLGLVGVGTWTAVACAGVAALTTLLYLVACLRRRPRVVLTPDGFVAEKLFGRDARRWDEIDGPFAVIRIGWGEAVGYKLTPACRARTRKKSPPGLSGYDGAVAGSALPCSAGELAELLNEHMRGARASAGPVPPSQDRAGPDAPGDRPRE